MEKDFDTWNEEKKVNNKKEIDRNLFYTKRDVWWCSIGVNVGVETDGKNKNFERPVLIIRKFNQYMFWGVPLTSNDKTGEFHQKITYEGGCAWVMLSQLKTFSTKRLVRRIGKLTEDQFETVKKKIMGLL